MNYGLPLARRSLYLLDGLVENGDVRRVKPRQHQNQRFAVQGPRVWNSLPAELRDPDIAMDTFRNRLKTFLFDMQL